MKRSKGKRKRRHRDQNSQSTPKKARHRSRVEKKELRRKRKSHSTILSDPESFTTVREQYQDASDELSTGLSTLSSSEVHTSSSLDSSDTYSELELVLAFDEDCEMDVELEPQPRILKALKRLFSDN